MVGLINVESDFGDVLVLIDRVAAESWTRAVCCINSRDGRRERRILYQQQRSQDLRSETRRRD